MKSSGAQSFNFRSDFTPEAVNITYNVLIEIPNINTLVTKPSVCRSLSFSSFVRMLDLMYTIQGMSKNWGQITACCLSERIHCECLLPPVVDMDLEFGPKWNGSWTPRPWLWSTIWFINLAKCESYPVCQGHSQTCGKRWSGGKGPGRGSETGNQHTYYLTNKEAYGVHLTASNSCKGNTMVQWTL